MSVKRFLGELNFKPYASVINSWDSFGPSGSVLMQLWAEPGQRVRGHVVSGAYLRVRCWNADQFEREGRNHRVGYNGRLKAIEAIEAGAKGYAALSDAPAEKRGPGVWADNCDLSKVYPVLAIEQYEQSGDIFAILGTPIRADAIAEV